jgi:hypothetical protein
MSAVFGMLVTRVSAAYAPTTKMLRRRIMVFGSGAQAVSVKNALERSDPAAEIMLQGNEDSPTVPVKQLLSRKKIAPKNPQSYFLDAQVNYQRGSSMRARISPATVAFAQQFRTAGQIAGAIEYQLGSFLQAKPTWPRHCRARPTCPWRAGC